MMHFLLWILVLLAASAPVAARAADRCALPAAEALRGEVKLPAGCTFESELSLATSGTHLDCQGSVFDGGGKLDTGLLIRAEGAPLSDIRVRRCVFRNFSHNGVRIELRGPKTDRDRAYRLAPQDIELDALTIDNSGAVGVYLNDYVTRVTLRNSTVQGSGSTAVYLDLGTRDNRIVGNRFIGNGFDRDGKPRREAIAVDSSADNVIQDNLFSRNARGAVFLYKNCGEKASTGKSPTRWQHSDRNRIVGNTFDGEKIGVWVASRQSTDLSRWDCGDAAMDPGRRYYEDFADDNEVSDNRFCGVAVPVRIEGDRNRVQRNRYDAAAKAMVDLPVSERERWKARASSGNSVEQNERSACNASALTR